MATKYESAKSRFMQAKFNKAMSCAEAKELLSPYLDGAVTGTEMQLLRGHLDGCAECLREYTLLRQTQQLVMGLGRVMEPVDLGLKLRLAISREGAGGAGPVGGWRGGRGAERAGVIG